MNTDFLPWTDSYSNDIAEIDEQHKILVRILNNLYAAFIKKEHEQKLGEILSELVNYTKVHFSNEEKYFSKFNYSDSTLHIKEHQDFIKKIKSFQDDINSKKSFVTYSLINFLKDWLTNHIMVEDKKYTSCFKENGL